jgi:hypothetical protein
MSGIDEKFARLQREVEKLEEKEIRNKLYSETTESKEETKKESTISEEEVEKAVASGYLKIGNRKITFEETSFYENKISMMFPTKFFTSVESKENYHIYMNFNYDKRPGEINIKRIKDELNKSLKASKLKTNWIEEGSKRIGEEIVYYSIFSNDVGGDEIVQYMMYVKVDEGHMVMTHNYRKEEEEEWGLIVNGILKTIKTKK